MNNTDIVDNENRTMYRIVDVPLVSVEQSCEDVSEKLNFAANRMGGFKVTGLGVVTDRLMFFLEPVTDNEAVKYYRLSLIERGCSVDEAIAEAKARYYAGFNTVGVFEYNERLWGLFCRGKES